MPQNWAKSCKRESAWYAINREKIVVHTDRASEIQKTDALRFSSMLSWLNEEEKWSTLRIKKGWNLAFWASSFVTTWSRNQRRFRLNIPVPERIEHYAEVAILIGPILSISSGRIERMLSRGENYIQSLDAIRQINNRGSLWFTSLNV